MAEKKTLIEHLKLNYGNLESPLYYSGITNIYNYYKGKLPIKDIEDFLSSNYTYSIYRQWKDIKPKNPTFCYELRFQFQSDIVEVSKIKKYNSGFSYILTTVDIWSRKAFCRLMRSKSAEETTKCMADIFKEAVKPPLTILFDDGKVK